MNKYNTTEIKEFSKKYKIPTNIIQSYLSSLKKPDTLSIEMYTFLMIKTCPPSLKDKMKTDLLELTSKYNQPEVIS